MVVGFEYDRDPEPRVSGLYCIPPMSSSRFAEMHFKLLTSACTAYYFPKRALLKPRPIRAFYKQLHDDVAIATRVRSQFTLLMNRKSKERTLHALAKA